MLKTNRSYRRALQVVLASGVAMFAGASFAAQFLYTGGHGLDDQRLAALGHTYTEIPANDAGWASALSGGYGPFTAIVVGENSRYNPLTLATSQAIASYVARGGRVIVSGDHNGNVEFLNAVFGYSAVVQYGCNEDRAVATRQSAAIGTSFANAPLTVANLSCTSAFTSASIPSQVKKMYQGSDNGTVTTLAFGASYSTGALVWMGWDFFQDGTEAQQDEWYMVLDSGLKFASSSCASQGLTGPKLTLCTMTCAAAPNSLQQRNLITLFTALYGSAPSCPTPPARAPEAVLGGGGEG